MTGQPHTAASKTVITGLLVLLLVAILSAVWSFAVSRFLRADAWGEP